MELKVNKPVEHYPNKIKQVPFVSVLVIAYQQASYIKECLDGILMQKTDFDFELILGEDESTDGTREICIEYAEKFPDKIRLFLHSRENVIYFGGRPSGRFNFLYSLSQSKGKYVALCEGDDYWTDPLKLQKQADFLEANSEYAMTSHEIKKVREGLVKKSKSKKAFQFLFNKIFKVFKISNMKGRYDKPLIDADFDQIINHTLFIATNSMVFKRDTIKIIPEWFNKLHAIHEALIHLITSQGKNHHFNEVMGVKRKNPGGITQDKKRKKWLEDKRISFHIFMYENFKTHLNGTKEIAINKKLKKLYMKQTLIELKNLRFKNSFKYFSKKLNMN